MPYNFITLNAGSMIAEHNFRVVKQEKFNGNNAALFEYDLSTNGADIREIVINEMEQQDNALFWQLEQGDVIKKHLTENEHPRASRALMPPMPRSSSCWSRMVLSPP